VDVNAKCYDGRTALHLAASGSSLEMVGWLVVVINLDVDVEDAQGKTPYSHAEDDEISEYLSFRLPRTRDLNGM
jgi:Ankyrin repeats (many copies)